MAGPGERRWRRNDELLSRPAARDREFGRAQQPLAKSEALAISGGLPALELVDGDR